MRLRKRNISSFYKSLAISISISLVLTSVPWHNHPEGHAEDLHLHHTYQLHLTDPCHNYIYHGDLSSDCERHSHASENELDCLICHFHQATQKILVAFNKIQPFQYKICPLPAQVAHWQCASPDYTQPQRGPPRLV
jgi:hypothetical protein